MFNFNHNSMSSSRSFIKVAIVILLVIGFSISPLGVHAVHAVSFTDALWATWNASPLGLAWNYVLSPGISFFADSIVGNAFEFVTGLILRLGSWLVSVAGSLLDLAIIFSVDTNNLQLAGVQEGWSIFRDLANMAFIFILIYIGLATILQLSNFNTKRILIVLIIVALLVNFSYFLTGIAIDASNILSTFLYSDITDNGSKSIGSIIANDGLKLPSMFVSLDSGKPGGSEQGVANLMGSVFFFVTAFVLFYGAILFVLRSVVLMFLLVTAPLAFVAAILPKTRPYWDEWLGKLISHSFVAPAYLLLISVIIKLIESDGITNALPADVRDQTFAAAMTTITKGGSAFFIILNFILIIGLMLAAHRITNTMAGGISKLSVKWAGSGIGLAAGGAALAGRQTFGRIGYGITKSDRLQKAAEESGARGFAARLALRGGDRVSRASYDVRSGLGAKAVGATVGTALGVAGARPNLGKAQTGGRAAREKELEERRSARAGVFTSPEAQRQYLRGVEQRSPGGLVRRAVAAASEQGVAVDERRALKEARGNMKKREKELRKARQNEQAGLPGSTEAVKRTAEAVKNARAAVEDATQKLQAASPYEADLARRTEQRLTKASKIRGERAKRQELRKQLEELQKEAQQTSPPAQEKDDRAT